MPSIFEFFSQLFHPQAKSPASAREQCLRLSAEAAETDNTFYPGLNMRSLYRSRYDYDRRAVLAACLSLWRTNAIARRIVKLMSMFVVGEGIQLSSDHKSTHDFLQTWWSHPLNRIGWQLIPWVEEAVRSGNLFFLCSVDQNTGMLYVRAVPADQVDEIISADNDVQQEIAYKPVDPLKDPWPAFNPLSPDPSTPFMLHYAFNQPVGVAWGEPDLAPMVEWLNWYSEFLEDRVRLHHYRNAYLYVVSGMYPSRAEQDARQRELMVNPPKPGSILVTNDTEKWSILNPQLAGSDAEADGLALKKMIAIGAGVPVHYLAEPESSTRTTAEAAGTPTFRGLEQMQHSFLDILEEIAGIAVQCRKGFDRRVNPSAKIQALGPDITERDNSLLALAVARIYPAVSDLYDRSGIDSQEFLRLVYRMAGEVLPSDAVPSIQKRPLKPVGAGIVPARPSIKGGKAEPAETDPGAVPPVEEG